MLGPAIRPSHLVLSAAASTVLLTSLFIAAPASASPSPAEIPDSSWIALDAAIAGTVFDGAKASAAGVPAALVSEFATGWRVAGNATANVVVDERLMQELETDTATARACAGRNSLDYTGLQLNAYLNSCNSAKLLGMVTSAAGVGVVAAAVTSWTGVGGVAAGAIAGAFTVSAGIIQVCSANGRGIAAHMIPPTAAMWCNNQ